LGILKELLKEIKTDESFEKIRMLCDDIFNEEKDNLKYTKILPKGPNLFLVLEVPGRTEGEIAFLALERESDDLYLLVLFVTHIRELKKTKDEPISMKRQQVWQIKDNRPEQVLTAYAKRYKFLRGE
jgi:hypothetical protein